MNRTLTTSIISIALAGGGVIGLGTIAAASYGDETPTLEETVDDGSAETDADADESSDDVDPTGLQAATDDTDATADEAEAEDDGTEREGGCGDGMRSSEAVAEALGLTADELQSARAEGQSLADIAAAQGVPTDTVVDAIVDGIETHLAEEVAEGDLTQAEADERLATAEERAAEKVDAAPGEGAAQGLRGNGGRRGPATASADA